MTVMFICSMLWYGAGWLSAFAALLIYHKRQDSVAKKKLKQASDEYRAVQHKALPRYTSAQDDREQDEW